MWWNHDLGWAGWTLMTVGTAGFWVLVALLVVAVVRNGQSNTPRDGAREILDRRLASGEIDVDDYHQRLDALEKAH